MPDKTWTEVWLLGPWTGFAMNTAGLLISVGGLILAGGARKAAREARNKIENFNRSLEISSLILRSNELKEILLATSYDRSKASTLCSRIREVCVILRADKSISKNENIKTQLDKCIAFFGTLEYEIHSGSFEMSIASYNEKHDMLISLNQHIKELNISERS